eukprot:3103929-Amphidinium_carterae.1
MLQDPILDAHIVAEQCMRWLRICLVSLASFKSILSTSMQLCGPPPAGISWMPQWPGHECCV